MKRALLLALSALLPATGLSVARGTGLARAVDAWLKLSMGVEAVSPAGSGGFATEDSAPRIKQAPAAVFARAQRPALSRERDIKDLPLVEVPATAATDEGPRRELMAVMLSGDGGWAELVREISKEIADHGIPVVGLDCLKYFWTRRTPEGAARDLAAILNHYLGAWGKEKVILIGYSLGADVLPFLVNRLPAALDARIDLIALLGPGGRAEFEFHLVNWLGVLPADTRPTLPEVRKLGGKKIACIFGEKEKESLCRSLDSSLAELISFPGGHHFGRNYRGVAGKILSLEAPSP